MDIKKYVKNNIGFIRDYIFFNQFYHESSSFWKFLWYRYFPKFKQNKYWPCHKYSEVRGRVVIGGGVELVIGPIVSFKAEERFS